MTKSSFDTPSPCLPAQPTARRPTMQTPLQPGPKVIFCVRGAISPLLANLFLHYAFDMWMTRTYPTIPFARYADDAICHCKSAEEAQALWSALADRFAAYKLTLHPEKTKIVWMWQSLRVS